MDSTDELSYEDFDLQGYSSFEYTVNFIVDLEYGFRPSVCRFHGDQINSDYGLKSDLSLNIARLRDIKLTFNTYEKTTGEKNKFYVGLPMGTKNFILEGFKTIELNRLYFVNQERYDDVTNSEIVRSFFRVQRSFLNSKFSLLDCKIHTSN